MKELDDLQKEIVWMSEMRDVSAAGMARRLIPLVTAIEERIKKLENRKSRKGTVAEVVTPGQVKHTMTNASDPKWYDWK